MNVHFEMGLLYKIQKETDLAVTHFTKCKNLKPESSFAKRAEKYIEELM